jgi:hypothetical protein
VVKKFLMQKARANSLVSPFITHRKKNGAETFSTVEGSDFSVKM